MKPTPEAMASLELRLAGKDSMDGEFLKTLGDTASVYAYASIGIVLAGIVVFMATRKKIYLK